MNDQTIVAVKLTDDPRQRHASNNMPQKAKLAVRLKNDDWEISFSIVRINASRTRYWRDLFMGFVDLTVLRTWKSFAVT